MSATLTRLHNLPTSAVASDADNSRIERLRQRWHLITERQPQPIIELIQTIYYMILEHYETTRRPLPFASVSRLYAKRLQSLLRKMNMQDLPLRDLVACVELSKTAPITVTYTPRAGILLLPGIVMQTYWSRQQRGESVGDLDGILNGKVDGPMLSPAGRELANSPFDTFSSDNPGHSEHKLDTPHFPSVDPADTTVPYPDEAPTDQ